MVLFFELFMWKSLFAILGRTLKEFSDGSQLGLFPYLSLHSGDKEPAEFLLISEQRIPVKAARMSDRWEINILNA